jgi:diguanylate cyclase (GGDEF)-like protein
VALVLLDLDEFKGVNDREGHQRGDDLLRSVATTLHGLIRGSEVVGRLGGDEFAVLMPETALEGAAATAERMRQAIERLPLAAANGVSASAGVAELGQAESADELVRLADRALYWSKLRGRNRVTIYSPDEVRELSAQERADQLARGHVLGAVRVLARVVDLKDASTSRHSERVADLAVLLAAELGWDAERCARMRDAALVHDVGKLALPAELVARAPTPTDENALAAVEAHPVISAEIAAEALDAEQVRWIREHHERPDGTGYPAGLVGDQISDGGRILAFANSWDVMTSDRPGQPATAAEAACDVCRSQAGRAFDAEVCSAFLALWEGGRIDR